MSWSLVYKILLFSLDTYDIRGVICGLFIDALAMELIAVLALVILELHLSVDNVGGGAFRAFETACCNATPMKP